MERSNGRSDEMLDDDNKKAKGILRAASVRCSKEVIYPLKGGRELGLSRKSMAVEVNRQSHVRVCR